MAQALLAQTAVAQADRLDAIRAATIDTPLVGLAGSDLGERFRHWHGASGRRYLFSVFPANDCPAYAESVLLAVHRAPNGSRRIVHVDETGLLPEVVFGGLALQTAVRAGANEIHLHVLAQTAHARVAIIDDLNG